MPEHSGPLTKFMYCAVWITQAYFTIMFVAHLWNGEWLLAVRAIMTIIGLEVGYSIYERVLGFL